MSASKRAQELAEQLLGIEASMAVPEAARYSGALDDIKGFYARNKKAIAIVAGVAAAAAVGGWAYKRWGEKKQ